MSDEQLNSKRAKFKPILRLEWLRHVGKDDQSRSVSKYRPG